MLGKLSIKKTALDSAYELLEKAENTKSKPQAIKYAKEAYKMCSACFDAIILQAELEDNPCFLYCSLVYILHPQ